jgi:hypothetical protein
MGIFGMVLALFFWLSAILQSNFGLDTVLL